MYRDIVRSGLQERNTDNLLFLQGKEKKKRKTTRKKQRNCVLPFYFCHQFCPKEAVSGVCVCPEDSLSLSLFLFPSINMRKKTTRVVLLFPQLHESVLIEATFFHLTRDVLCHLSSVDSFAAITFPLLTIVSYSSLFIPQIRFQIIKIEFANACRAFGQSVILFWTRCKSVGYFMNNVRVRVELY